VSVALAMLVAVLLDALLGEPRRAHPLVAFGWLAGKLEARWHADRRMAGVLAWTLTVVPIVAAAGWLSSALPAWLSFVFDAGVLYLAIGHESLAAHARPVARALASGDLASARIAVGRMVSRDTDLLDDTQVVVAATESVLENGNDAIFGALFWFVLLGAPGAVLYRLANTLDAMWGYRTPRYENFGWAAARIDDALNFVPARLTAFTYALFGDFPLAMRCWRKQAPAWDSPNAGPVMAAGAGALSVRLGGAAPYHGVWEARPVLGDGNAPGAEAIERALRLVRNGLVGWIAMALLLAMLHGVLHA
jgi:adenosylcobinamide-phosphate synthase